MRINHLYDTWFRRIQELRPGQRITQVRIFTWLLVGIFQSRSVNMSRVASKLPGQAHLLSITRRLSRLLNNPAIQVREWYAPIAQQWLEAQFRWLGEIRLIVDSTKIGFQHQLLMVALAYRHQAIPIAWTWVPYVRGHSPVRQQLALLAYVREHLLPKGAGVFLVGDCEFGSVAIMRQLNQWRWFYVLRQKASTHLWRGEERGWEDFGRFAPAPGWGAWLGSGYLTETEIFPVNLWAYWKIGEKEPWCLATNLPDEQLARAYYCRRMWIEEMFGDLKKHGFDLERTMLRHFLRLSRLTLAVALLYLWLIATGIRTIRKGWRQLVDRKNRRDLSVFQIGLRFIERRLTNELPIGLPLCL